MVKMEPNAIHPAAFMNQPVATPHQPRYAQQLPPGGSQEEETMSNLQLTYHVVPGTAGRQVGTPYRDGENRRCVPFNLQHPLSQPVRAASSPRGGAEGTSCRWVRNQRIGTGFVAALKNLLQRNGCRRSSFM